MKQRVRVGHQTRSVSTAAGVGSRQCLRQGSGGATSAHGTAYDPGLLGNVATDSASVRCVSNKFERCHARAL